MDELLSVYSNYTTSETIIKLLHRKYLAICCLRSFSARIPLALIPDNYKVDHSNMS